MLIQFPRFGVIMWSSKFPNNLECKICLIKSFHRKFVVLILIMQINEVDEEGFGCVEYVMQIKPSFLTESLTGKGFFYP